MIDPEPLLRLESRKGVLIPKGDTGVVGPGERSRRGLLGVRELRGLRGEMGATSFALYDGVKLVLILKLKLESRSPAIVEVIWWNW